MVADMCPGNEVGLGSVRKKVPHFQQVPGDIASKEVKYHTFNAQLLEEPASFLSLCPKKLMSQERWHQKVIHPVPSWRVFPPICNVCQDIIKIVLVGLQKILQSCSGYHTECPHGFHLSPPVKPPNANPTSVFGPDPFISVLIHPRKDMIMCIAPGLRITSLNLSGSHHFTFCPTM